MARSSANTPAPARKSNPSGAFVWVNDWYIPDSFENISDTKLKGWHKVAINKDNNPEITMGAKDIVDLNNMKYYEEVPILSHNEVVQLEEVKTEEIKTEEKLEKDANTETKAQLGTALNMEVEEGQVSSLSGIA